MTKVDFEKYRDKRQSEPPDGFFRNWMGIVTDLKFFPHMAEFDGRIIPSLPSYDLGDGFYGGYNEYASVFFAVEDRTLNDKFVAVELGAGWGPWITTAGIAAKESGAKLLTLRAVEADETRCGSIHEHLQRNGLSPSNAIDVRVIHGAAWHEDAIVRFGISDPFEDHGGAATKEVVDNDYRGHSVTYNEVKAFSLKTICDKLKYVDYMHWDVQGAELEIADASIDFLNDKVRYLFIGTHSIAIHGKLIEHFFKAGWNLLSQKPPSFNFDPCKPTLEAMGTSDGDLFLENLRLTKRRILNITGCGLKLIEGRIENGVLISGCKRGLIACGPYSPIRQGRYVVQFIYSSAEEKSEKIASIKVSSCIPGRADTLKTIVLSGTSQEVHTAIFEFYFPEEDRLFEISTEILGPYEFKLFRIILDKI